MRSNRIIHNAKDRLSRAFCFPIDNLYDTAFQSVFQSKVIPFAMVEKISSSCSVVLADFSKINGFSSVTTEKNRNNNGH